MQTEDGSKTKWANCMCLRSLTALATVYISQCMTAALTRLIAPPVQSFVPTSDICQYGKTRRLICSLPWKHCGPIRPTCEHGKSTSRNWPMRRRSSKPSKRRASGMGASTTPKHTRSEQCRKNAQAKSERKRQVAFAAIRDLQQENHPVTRSAVAKRAGVSVVFLRSHPDL